ncbi:MAG TPA: DUF4124 domain-containing protein [Gammaproteobacteria bacterium]
MRKWWLSLIALASGAASAVPVWRWVDENGVTHYSDLPVPGAERIELTSAQTIRSQARAAPSVAPPAAEQPRAQAQPYRRFNVITPSQQQTLWNIGGTLDVQLDLDPPLQAGHTLDVYLDGQRRNLSSTSPQLSVPEVFRGVHTLQAAIFDENGNEIVRSLAVTFMVQQTSILNPNNPNGVRAGGN